MKGRPRATFLEAALGVALDPALLERSLTHRSYAYENGGLPTNERLEFLGDSVLGVVVTAALFNDHPDLPEGQLAKLRASVVNMRALAEVARGLGPYGLGPHLLLGKGEETTGGRDKASILADTLEALLGAVYLQHGLDVAGDVIHRLFDPLMIDAAGRGAALDWKTSLQELTASLGLGVPEYRVDEAGPDHAKIFTAWAVVAGGRHGGSQGRSKKEAEQRAAEAAWLQLSIAAEEKSAAEKLAEEESAGDSPVPEDATGKKSATQSSAPEQPGTAAGAATDKATDKATGEATDTVTDKAAAGSADQEAAGDTPA